jgi:5'-3' exonuclease
VTQVYLAGDVKKEMGLHREDLVALAYFLGSDYTEGVTGVGIVNAVEIVHAFSMRFEEDTDANIEAVIPAQVSDDAKSGPLKGLRAFRDWLNGYEFASEIFHTSSSSSSSSNTTVNAELEESPEMKIVRLLYCVL